MPVELGLPLLGILVIVLVLAREAARRYNLRREHKRRTAKYYWQPTEAFGTTTQL